mmetsp:Transcript_10588/g.28370  ORF Transcript_10588/g.28370 Transcript_10588/m.28370 type:complete len:230 (-) Transcript_10588:1019-1708(-)
MRLVSTSFSTVLHTSRALSPPTSDEELLAICRASTVLARAASKRSSSAFAAAVGRDVPAVVCTAVITRARQSSASAAAAFEAPPAAKLPATDDAADISEFQRLSDLSPHAAHALARLAKVATPLSACPTTRSPTRRHVLEPIFASVASAAAQARLAAVDERRGRTFGNAAAEAGQIAYAPTMRGSSTAMEDVSASGTKTRSLNLCQVSAPRSVPFCSSSFSSMSPARRR